MRASFIKQLSASVFAYLVACTGALAQGPSYDVTFEPLWSATAHPQDFPIDPHFSALVGTTHDATLELWNAGVLASPGIKDVAEIGDGSQLAAEILAAVSGGQASGVLVGAAFFLPGSDSVSFETDLPHTRLSLVNMIAPSPDWFTGISGVKLHQNGSWVKELIIDVFPYDAGTDSGITYTSPDQPTVPPQPIAQIFGAPFQNGGSVAPVGRFIIRRADVPVCDFELTQSTYNNGDVFTVQSWTLSNADTESRSVELKAWLVIPGLDPFPIFNLGADGTFILSPESSLDLGSFPLFTVDATFPRGTYEFNCRLVDPTTGEGLTFDRNQVEVQ